MWHWVCELSKDTFFLPAWFRPPSLCSAWPRASRAHSQGLWPPKAAQQCPPLSKPCSPSEGPHGGTPGLRAPCLCSPHLLLCPCQLPPSCILWARAGGGPTVRRACGLGPQFDSPFRALLPPGHYPSQTHVAPLPTPRSHSLKHHNSLKLSLYLPTRKQWHVLLFKNKIGTVYSWGVSPAG